MVSEGGMIGESSCTHLTLEWLFPCAVGALMHFEVVRTGKSTLTRHIGRAFLQCVGALMPFDVGRLGESSITHLVLLNRITTIHRVNPGGFLTATIPPMPPHHSPSGLYSVPQGF